MQSLYVHPKTNWQAGELLRNKYASLGNNITTIFNELDKEGIIKQQRYNNPIKHAKTQTTITRRTNALGLKNLLPNWTLDFQLCSFGFGLHFPLPFAFF